MRSCIHSTNIASTYVPETPLKCQCYRGIGEVVSPLRLVGDAESLAITGHRCRESGGHAGGTKYPILGFHWLSRQIHLSLAL